MQLANHSVPHHLGEHFPTSPNSHPTHVPFMEGGLHPMGYMPSDNEGHVEEEPPPVRFTTRLLDEFGDRMPSREGTSPSGAPPSSEANSDCGSERQARGSSRNATPPIACRLDVHKIDLRELTGGVEQTGNPAEEQEVSPEELLRRGIQVHKEREKLKKQDLQFEARGGRKPPTGRPGKLHVGSSLSARSSHKALVDKRQGAETSRQEATQPPVALPKLPRTRIQLSQKLNEANGPLAPAAAAELEFAAREYPAIENLLKQTHPANADTGMKKKLTPPPPEPPPPAPIPPQEPRPKGIPGAAEHRARHRVQRKPVDRFLSKSLWEREQILQRERTPVSAGADRIGGMSSRGSEMTTNSAPNSGGKRLKKKRGKRKSVGDSRREPQATAPEGEATPGQDFEEAADAVDQLAAELKQITG